jgi:hypothetical protein
MIVYKLSNRGEANSRVHVQPGKDHPNKDFCNEDGTPILFTVQFKNGEAEVASNLGRYLIAQGLAQGSRIIIPKTEIAAAPARTMRNYTAA